MFLAASAGFKVTENLSVRGDGRRCHGCKGISLIQPRPRRATSVCKLELYTGKVQRTLRNTMIVCNVIVIRLNYRALSEIQQLATCAAHMWAHFSCEDSNH